MGCTQGKQGHGSEKSPPSSPRGGKEEGSGAQQHPQHDNLLEALLVIHESVAGGKEKCPEGVALLDLDANLICCTSAGDACWACVDEWKELFIEHKAACLDFARTLGEQDVPVLHTRGSNVSFTAYDLGNCHVVFYSRFLEKEKNESDASNTITLDELVHVASEPCSQLQKIISSSPRDEEASG